MEDNQGILIVVLVGAIIAFCFASQVSKSSIDKCQQSTEWSKEKCTTEISR